MAHFDNSFYRDLVGFYEEATLHQAPASKMVIWNALLAQNLGLEGLSDDAKIWSGSKTPKGAEPIATAYSGHQFGGFSPRLGDGRATLIGEVVNNHGERVDIQWKGSGKTPFSRSGTDGKAALGPALREYLMSEAMNALGVPTTRALAVALTGEDIFREGMKPGAVFTRVASSHLRVGSFQYAATLRDRARLQALADYAIARHFPDIESHENKYLAFLLAVIERQAKLIAKWVSLGFVHGVMNTDNMTISGETIDYGPCAFMENYEPATVFSSIDHGGRYAYGNQPVMAQWNLARFAESILPLLRDDQDEALELAERAIAQFADQYVEYWLEEMCTKIGINEPNPEHAELVNGLLTIMKSQNADFTRSFRFLGDDDRFLAEFDDQNDARSWLQNWRRMAPDTSAEVIQMRNPIYIPRNHLVDHAIKAAEDHGDFDPFHKVLSVTQSPYVERAELAEFATSAPDEFGPFVTFCGT